MKNFCLTALLILGTVSWSLSQNVPNGGFEDWEDTGNGIMEPVEWQTNNMSDLVFVTQEAGHSGESSARISVMWDESLNMNITPAL